jgi:D-alanine--poly(phosphoribitol) ligase subunit 1
MKDCIDIIKENSKLNPKCIAVIDGEREINYLDFMNLVSYISNNLISIKSSPKVAFDLNQSIESYALIIAILNIGGTYCPLNTQAPIDRKNEILDEFKPDILIIEEGNNTNNYHIRNISPISSLIEGKTVQLNINYNQDDTIYVIYTSGSTGSPKGVMISRKALNKFLDWSIPTYNAKENDIWGQFSLLSFDLSIVDIFTCLCSGATLLVMADAASKLRPSNSIEKNRINIWHSIPSAVEFMIKNDAVHSSNFDSLKLMSFCGEPLRKHHLDFLFEKNKKLRIFNTYGPTEGTLFCTWHEFNSSDYENFCESTMSIGKAIPGWKLQLNKVDGLEEKEIIIYGDYIGKGYLVNGSDSKFKTIEIKGDVVNSFETGDLVIEKNENLFFSCRNY